MRWVGELQAGRLLVEVVPEGAVDDQLVTVQVQSLAVVAVLLYLQLQSCQMGGLVLVQLPAELELVVELLNLWLC